MNGANRRRRPGRREPFRDPRPMVLIVCEGTSEQEYFEKFANHHRNSRVRVELESRTGVPFSLVQLARERKRRSDAAAKRQRDENLSFDSIWCVFDIDEHPHVSDAREMARDNGIHLAISNPCFELWLILHLRSSPGMKDRHNTQRLLKKLVPDYDKHIDFSRYVEGYPDAVVRARSLDDLAQRVGTPGHNPTTNVYELTESILP